MSLANKARQAQALEQARNNQQTEFSRRRVLTNQAAAWRTELGTEAPSGSVASAMARIQTAIDEQRASWQTELGDPAPSFYGDAPFISTRDLIAALGGDASVIGLWDYRYGLAALSGVVDAWVDVRGGPVLVGSGTGRPACSSSGLTFNGTTHFLRALAGLSGITGSCALIMIARGVSVPDRREWELSTDSTTSILSGSITSGPGWTTSGLAVSGVSQTAPTASARIFHARRTVTVDVGTRVGSVAEVTAVSAAAAATANRLTIGGSRADSPALFSGLVDLKAVILLAGVYSPAQAALINAWAQTQHGAVLTN
jgi:hypothetical protein